MFARPFSLKKSHMVLTAAALGTVVLWGMCWDFGALLFGQSLPSADALLGPFVNAASPVEGTGAFLYALVEACLFAPVLEELFWRWTFGAIAYDRLGKSRESWSLPVLVFGCGLLFALSHGFRYGFTYVMIIQLAPLGLVLGGLWVLLKRRGASTLVALACCATVHAGYNFTVLTTRAMMEQAQDAGAKECLDQMDKLLEKAIAKPAPE